MNQGEVLLDDDGTILHDVLLSEHDQALCLSLAVRAVARGYKHQSTQGPPAAMAAEEAEEAGLLAPPGGHFDDHGDAGSSGEGSQDGRTHRLNDLEVGGRPIRMCVVGGGACIQPMALCTRQRDMGTEAVRVDVVDVSPGVLAVAQAHFGVKEGAGLCLHCAEGQDFLAHAPLETTREETTSLETGLLYDIIVIDAADPGSRTGCVDHPLQSPGKSFLAADFLRKIVKQALQPDGVLALSAIGMPSGLISVGDALDASFDSVWGLVTADMGFVYYACDACRAPHPELVTSSSLSEFAATSQELSPLLEEFTALDGAGGMGHADGEWDGFDSPEAARMWQNLVGWHSWEQLRKALQLHQNEFIAFRGRQQERALGQVGREEGAAAPPL